VARRASVALWPAAVALGLGAEWASLDRSDLVQNGADLAVGWLLLGCGLVAWSRRPRSRIGLLLAVTGITWFLGSFESSGVGVLSALGGLTVTLHRGPLVHAILTYPSGRLSGRLDRMVVAAVYLDAAIVPLAQTDPLTIALALVVAAVAGRRYRLASGAERHARAPALAAATAVSAVLAAASLGRLSGAGHDRLALWAYELALGVVAVVFLADLLRGRWAQAAVTDLVVELSEPAEAATLRAKLARALGDPSLVLGYWLPEAGGYVDDAGRSVLLPELGSGRGVTLIEQGGERIGALVHDAAVLDDAALVDAVASAAKMAVSNVRLQAEVRDRVDELRASRRRLVEAGDEQRRRLERELREGAERRLSGVAELLGETRRDAGETPAGSLLGDAEGELQHALTELRELAHGIHPAELIEGGLAVALTGLARRSPVPVELELPSERLPAPLEAAAYFVCSEALANVAKYARASRVTIDVARTGSRVVVAIADDGVGGADPTRGSGLRGLADRVEALGGQLRVESPRGGGTRLLAEIALG
jgi:signal transduction histidine kinase